MGLGLQCTLPLDRVKMSREVDALVGLNLLVPNVEEWISAVCRKRLSEPGTDCIRLFFGEGDEVMVQKYEALASLKEALEIV
jgi:hypothetical protein